MAHMHHIKRATRILVVLFPLLISVVALSCHKEKKSTVPEGYKTCTYCCTTAHTPCTCTVLKVVQCPEPDNTAILPACAECRQCTERVDSEQQCHSPFESGS